MQMFVRLCPFAVVCSVFGFHKGSVKFLLGGFLFLNCVSCLKHLTLDYELGCGFLLFGCFKWIYEVLFLLFLFYFGLKVLYSDGFSRGLIQFLRNLRGKSGGLKYGCLKNIFNGDFGLLKLLNEESYVPLSDKMEEKKEKPIPNTHSDEEYDNDKEHSEENNESDVSKLRKLIKTERQKANAAYAELMKERTASATAAEEAMAMILRLQNEKSLIERELSQYRRLAEEKQIHDQQVIQSLQWLVQRHDSERSLLEDQLKLCRQKLKRLLRDEFEEVEEAQSSFSGNISDALENVLYSSRDANLSPQ